MRQVSGSRPRAATGCSVPCVKGGNDPAIGRDICTLVTPVSLNRSDPTDHGPVPNNVTALNRSGATVCDARDVRRLRAVPRARVRDERRTAMERTFDITQETVVDLPDRAALSLVNANLALPINVALAANVLSDNAVAAAQAQQTTPINQGMFT